MIQDRLDDVLERQDALEATVFVDDQADLLPLGQQGVPDVGHGLLFVEEGDVALDLAQAHIEFVFCQALEGIAAEDVARDVFGALAVDRDAGIVLEILVLVEIPQRHVFRRGLGHHAGRHHVVRLHAVELDDVLDDAVLVFVDHAFLFAHIGHG